MQRNVEFNKWIPRTETKNGGYTTDYPYAGIFLDWGLDSDEGASYTVALVEMADGSVKLVIPTRMRFCIPTLAPDLLSCVQDAVSDLWQHMTAGQLAHFQSVLSKAYGGGINDIPASVGGGYNHAEEEKFD